MEDIINEIWKPINGFPYSISNLGRVKKHFSTGRTKLKTASINGAGYYLVALYRNAERSNFNIHRLIAESFVPNPENKPCVNHKNGVKTDNRIDNLEWCSFSDNTQHGMRTGLMPYRCNARLTEDDVKYIRKRLKTRKELCEMFGVTNSNIGRILKGKSWKV